MKLITTAVFILAILFSSAASAQIVRTFGFKLGAADATQSIDFHLPLGLAADISYRWGYDFAGFVEFFNDPHFSVVAELDYVQKGFWYQYNSFDTGLESAAMNSRYDYLSIPVLAKVRYQIGILAPYVFAGPRFDRLLFTNATYLPFNEFGMSVGAGTEIDIRGACHLLMEARYSPSLAYSYPYNERSVKNESFEFQAGIGF
jgi:opacity protein-like surface antigen